mmetsp:Transcript_14470/g.28244  ORF Transcript_14470/g.28244 Transcript_14470/m.28244 type:complete len:205 (-) Transcript_14470:362-976(-)
MVLFRRHPDAEARDAAAASHDATEHLPGAEGLHAQPGAVPGRLDDREHPVDERRGEEHRCCDHRLVPLAPRGGRRAVGDPGHRRGVEARREPVGRRARGVCQLARHHLQIQGPPAYADARALGLDKASLRHWARARLSAVSPPVVPVRPSAGRSSKVRVCGLLPATPPTLGQPVQDALWVLPAHHYHRRRDDSLQRVLEAPSTV